VISSSVSRRPRDSSATSSAVDPERNGPHHLVYGIGRHACPGRGLATLELRALTQAVVARTSAVTPDPDDARARSHPPSGGYCRVPLVLR
jgi:cytochrome P450